MVWPPQSHDIMESVWGYLKSQRILSSDTELFIGFLQTICYIIVENILFLLG